jgi:hypothetical protein
MAKKKEHLKQAQINKAVFDYLGGKNPRFIDWAITTIFYIAVHHVEAAFACINGVCHTEVCKDRNDDMSYVRHSLVKNNLGRGIALCFNRLEQASKNVRYLINDYRAYYDKKVLSDFVDKDLKEIIEASSKVYNK